MMIINYSWASGSYLFYLYTVIEKVGFQSEQGSLYFYKAVVNSDIDCYFRKRTSAHEKMADQSCYKMNIFVSSLNRMHGIIQTVAV